MPVSVAVVTAHYTVNVAANGRVPVKTRYLVLKVV